MQSAGFISKYLFFDFSHQRLLISTPWFDAGVSFSRFDFGVNFSLKGCLHHSFVIRLEPLLAHMVILSAIPIRSKGKQNLMFVASLVAGVVVRRSMLTGNLLSVTTLWIYFQSSFLSGYGPKVKVEIGAK